MSAFFSRDRDQILRHALQKLSKSTPITAVAPGAIARAMIEVITDEIGGFYDTLDFNMSQSVISTATGRSLDLIGQLYSIQRKRLSDLASVDAQVGAFYFYLTTPHSTDIVIPRGVRVSTVENTVLGNAFIYATTDITVIPAGRLRGYASIRPQFEDSVSSAGVGMLVDHNFTTGPPGVTILCTNPKVIPASVGFESDDDYRTRIIKGVRMAAGGTSDAVRFTALSIPGVRDVRIRQTPYGLGTFEVIMVAEDYSIQNGLVNTARATLEAVRPVGTRMVVRQPDLQYVDVSVAATVRPGTNIAAAGINSRTRNAILRYLNTLLVADPFVYNQMISYILEQTDVITDVTVTSLAVNGKQVLRKNYTPQNDQQLVPGRIEVTTA